MELYHKILAEYFAEYGNLDEKINAAEIVCDRCYQALRRIKQILEYDSLEDPERFWRIEEIVNTLEELGTDAGTRHDFG